MCPIDVIVVGFEKLCTEGSRLITVMPDVIPEAHTEEGCALGTQNGEGITHSKTLWKSSKRSDDQSGYHIDNSFAFAALEMAV